MRLGSKSHRLEPAKYPPAALLRPVTRAPTHQAWYHGEWLACGVALNREPTPVSHGDAKLAVLGLIKAPGRIPPQAGFSSFFPVSRPGVFYYVQVLLTSSSLANLIEPERPTTSPYGPSNLNAPAAIIWARSPL